MVGCDLFHYCVNCQELLAVVVTLQHFRPYLNGQRFWLHTNHASLTRHLTFKDPEGQIACWLEQLQDYMFSVEHQVGRAHGNTAALIQHPCMDTQCHHCQCQDEQSRTEGAGRCAAVTLSAEPAVVQLNHNQLQLAQESNLVLSRVLGWVCAFTAELCSHLGQRPELKALHSHWVCLCERDGLLYHWWERPGTSGHVLQPVVPQKLRAKCWGSYMDMWEPDILG